MKMKELAFSSVCRVRDESSLLQHCNRRNPEQTLQILIPIQRKNYCWTSWNLNRMLSHSYISNQRNLPSLQFLADAPEINLSKIIILSIATHTIFNAWRAYIFAFSWRPNICFKEQFYNFEIGHLVILIWFIKLNSRILWIFEFEFE